jgi:hypothetical protein
VVLVREEEVVAIGRGMWGVVIRIDLRSGGRAGIAVGVQGDIGQERGVGVGVLIPGVGVEVGVVHRLGGVGVAE